MRPPSVSTLMPLAAVPQPTLAALGQFLNGSIPRNFQWVDENGADFFRRHFCNDTPFIKRYDRYIKKIALLISIQLFMNCTSVFFKPIFKKLNIKSRINHSLPCCARDGVAGGDHEHHGSRQVLLHRRRQLLRAHAAVCARSVFVVFRLEMVHEDPPEPHLKCIMLFSNH